MNPQTNDKHENFRFKFPLYSFQNCEKLGNLFSLSVSSFVRQPKPLLQSLMAYAPHSKTSVHRSVNSAWRLWNSHNHAITRDKIQAELPWEQWTSDWFHRKLDPATGHFSDELSTFLLWGRFPHVHEGHLQASPKYCIDLNLENGVHLTY